MRRNDPPETETIIDLNKKNLSDYEIKQLGELITQLDKDPTKTFKMQKSRGKTEEGFARRKPSKYGNVHLNASLIRFPNDDRYYVVGKKIGSGGRSKVKLLPYFFKKNAEGTLTRHEAEIDREEIIKIIKQTIKSNKKLAEEEITVANEAGEIPAVLGTNENKAAYIKMPLVKGPDLEHYLLEHKNLSLQERLHIIKLIIEKLKKMHGNHYFYLDIKPENIFFDGERITFVDWESAKKNGTQRDIPHSNMFTSGKYESDTLSQREGYALSGLIGIILSDFKKTDRYDETPVIQPKHRTYTAYAAYAANYDFSEIHKTFNLEKGSPEESALNAIIDNLKLLGDQDANKRDAISHNDYSILIKNILTLENIFKNKWLKNIVEDLLLSYPVSKDNKTETIHQLISFYKEKKLQEKDLHPYTEQLSKLFNNLIHASAQRQHNHFFWSHAIDLIKKNIPNEILNQLSEKSRDELSEYSSFSMMRFFKSLTSSSEEKKPPPTKKLTD